MFLLDRVPLLPFASEPGVDSGVAGKREVSDVTARMPLALLHVHLFQTMRCPRKLMLLY